MEKETTTFSTRQRGRPRPRLIGVVMESSLARILFVSQENTRHVPGCIFLFDIYLRRLYLGRMTTSLAVEAIVTPAALRRQVVAALQERVQLGDRLAEGAVKVIAHLEAQANALAWASVGKTCPGCDGDPAHPGVTPCYDCGTVCVHDRGCQEHASRCGR